MKDIDFALIAFDFKGGMHTETVIAHAGDPIASFNALMRALGEPGHVDAKVVRVSDSFESDLLYHACSGWRRGVADEAVP